MGDERFEFSDTYSDDILFLEAARGAMLKDPFVNRVSGYLDATIARIYAIMLVGSVEGLIEAEMERTDSSHLKAYFREKIPNEQKIAELDKYFGLVYGDSGVGAEVLSDYLAIKYLRNGIIHADRRTGHQAEFIRQRGFPVDSRQLKLSHLHKMAAVNATLLTYFGLPKAFAGLNEDFKFAGAPEAATSRIATDSQVKAPYSIKNFIQLHRRNLNNVGYKWAEFYDEISLNPLDRSMSVEIIEQLRGMDGKNPAHVRIASYGETALYSWTELTRLWPDLEGTNLLDDVDYRQRMLSVARSLVTDGVFLRGQPGTAVLLA